MPKKPQLPKSDAICFTSGLNGAPFSAGLIHAYLAAARPPPLIVAGISVGALSAAAMQRCYRELEKANTANDKDQEAWRWEWFRRYLHFLTDSPFNVIWDAVPDPVDISSGRPPVHDLSCPQTLRDHDAVARRKYFLLVRLGRWLAQLPVKVSAVAKLAVTYVQYKEKYGGMSFRRWLSYRLAQFRVEVGLLFHLARSPQWVWEPHFRDCKPAPVHGFNRLLHPLFGWRVWVTAVFATFVMPYWSIGVIWRGLAAFFPDSLESALPTATRLGQLIFPAEMLIGIFLAIAILIIGFAAIKVKPPIKSRIKPWLMNFVGNQLGLTRGLLSDYHLHRRLHKLFEEESLDCEPKIESEPMRLLVVAAPLNQLENLEEAPGGQLLWARRGAQLIQALRAALAVPGILAPQQVLGDRVDDWIAAPAGQWKPTMLDLVNGSAVRSNPIPALLSYLKEKRHRSLAAALESTPGDCRVHLVYSVPIVPSAKFKKKRPESLDIVEVARLSLQLANRRDTQMECQEVNFLSQVEHELFPQPKPAGEDRLLKIFIDEIAPTEDLNFKNSLAPTREEILGCAAAGCRRTLETLYAKQIGKRGVSCRDLLKEITPIRLKAMDTRVNSEAMPGLPEICRHCCGTLERKAEAAPEYMPSYAPSPSLLGRQTNQPGKRWWRWNFESEESQRLRWQVEEFPHLTGEKPRIVFLASGGVFRGATHIGVLAALRAAEIRPDLVIGASVGALIGGALAAISVLDHEPAYRLLGELVETFTHIDEKVALTRRLKNATRELGVRAKQIKLSPADLRQLILRGTRSDPGYAATGAPPAFIDALSKLILIPSSQTREVAREFLAGHQAKAARLLWMQIQSETLRRLDIEYEIMGTSLLEEAAYRLLGGGAGIDLHKAQPFHRDSRRVSFFCTASRLDNRSSLLLGRDFPPAATHFDFLKAVLASSAFPTIFSPQRESSIFPGCGRDDVLLSDGGMFDNLPFYPAVEVLSKMQQAYHKHHGLSAYEFLKDLYHQPALIIAAALETCPPPGSQIDFDNISAIQNRGSQLKSNLKMRWFEGTSKQLDQQLQRCINNNELKLGLDHNAFIAGIVHGGVLKVIPTDTEHLNPTYAFCASTGLRRDRVHQAIADGCFQTFHALAVSQRSDSLTTVLHHSVRKLHENGRLPILRAFPNQQIPDSIHCPFFCQDDRTFQCPFICAARSVPNSDAALQVYRFCTKDSAHRAALEPLR